MAFAVAAAAAIVPCHGLLAAGHWQCSETSRRDLLVVVDCVPGFATDHDRVLLYSRKGSPMAGKVGVLDTADAVWVFFPGATGSAKIVIDFHPSERGLVAELYDDRQGNGSVDYVLRKGVPVVRGAVYPTVKFIARDGWWQRGGLTNFNLDIEVNGDVLGSFGAERVMDRFRKNKQKGNLPHFFIRVGDRNHGGRPDSETIQVAPRLPISGAFIRTQAFVNADDSEYPITGSILWPYLGSLDLGGSRTIKDYFELKASPPCSVVKDYRVSPPPIQVAWKEGRVLCLGEFVASRFNEHNWFVYSIERQGMAESPPANWETFGFYDLADNHDGIPELIIRVLNWNADDPHADVRSKHPQNVVRYSWDQHSETDRVKQGVRSSYKVDLAGSYPITTTVDFPDMRMRAIPRADLPYWVTERAWGIAAFVAVEGEPYSSSEGIYEWDADRPELRYLAGLSDSDDPSQTYGDIPQGLRGEYHTLVEDRPWLYLSPVDRRLHLLHAQGGSWNLGAQGRLRYANLGGDYLNQWRLEQSGEQTASLTFVADQLMLAGPSGLRIKKAAVPPALFSTLPPRNHEEWVRLGSLLVQQQASFPGHDLQAMFDRFEGPVETLPGAQPRDFSLVEDGFRFVVRLPGGGAADVPWTVGLAPGSYLVRYRIGNGYSTEPLTPPALELSALEAIAENMAALEPIELSVTVLNSGAEDARALPITFSARHQRGPIMAVGSVPVDVAGGGSAKAGLRWTPPGRGEWTIEAAALQHEVAAARLDLAIAAAPAANLPALFAAQSFSGSDRLVIGALLGVAAALAGSLGLALWRGLSHTRKSAAGADRDNA